MKVHLYSMAWNEADMLGFFFRHYDVAVDRFVIFDNGSTDRTAELLRAHPRVEVRSFPWSDPNSFVESQRQLQNQVWKESRGKADWVIITALDEHLCLPGSCPGLRLRRYLNKCQTKGVTYVPALGYQMVSEEFPAAHELLCQTRTVGAPFLEMNKLSIFDPNAIEESGFTVGRHSAQPKGRLKLPDRDELLLLHYKYLGFQRTTARQSFLNTGLKATDFANKWGFQYSWTADELRANWDEFMRQADDVSRRDLEPWRSHPIHRWWRPNDAVRTAA